jgi:hypothetical protein
MNDAEIIHFGIQILPIALESIFLLKNSAPLFHDFNCKHAELGHILETLAPSSPGSHIVVRNLTAPQYFELHPRFPIVLQNLFKYVKI